MSLRICLVIVAVGAFVVLGCDSGWQELAESLGQGGTVASVSVPPSEGQGSRPIPGGGEVGVRIISRSPRPANVRVEFFFRGVTVHLAELRIEPLMTVEAIGPDVAEQIEVTGAYEASEPLPERTYLLGVDFEHGGLVIYYIGSVPPTLEILEPAKDVTVDQGEAFAVRWEDDDPDDNAEIAFMLDDPDETGLDGDEIPIGPAFAEDPDGDADRAQLNVGQTPPGTYRLVGLIRDPFGQSEAVGPGLVIIRPSGELENIAPAANDQFVATQEDTPVLIELDGVDPDNGPQPLQFAIADEPAHGVLSGFDPNAGTVWYTPDPDYNGDDAFRFTVFDGQATSEPGVVTIEVGPVNDPPAVLIDSVTLVWGALRSYDYYDQALEVWLYDQDDGEPSGVLTLRIYAVPAEEGEPVLVYEGPGDAPPELPGQPRLVVVEYISYMVPSGYYFIRAVLDDGELQAEDITEEPITIGSD